MRIFIALTLSVVLSGCDFDKDKTSQAVADNYTYIKCMVGLTICFRFILKGSE